MNVATVFKQSTTTSARMSTNIHRTELSSLSSIRFDQLATHKKKSVSGQAHHQLAINKHQIKTTTVLMESNSVLNVRQESDTDHHLQYRQRQQRRHSLSVRDERLLKILSAPPDEPLYINGTPDTKSTLNGDNDSSSSTDNLLMQLEEATSSITAIDDYENENLPPTNDKNAVAHSEDANLGTMSSTPQKGFSVAAWTILQRDLNSPSASCRMRAIRAINSPANGNYYSTFDQTNEENSIDEVECSIVQPRSISEVMKDVVVYVEYRSGTENRTIGIKDAIANLGAKVNDRLLRNTTHVVFKDGLQSTYNKAKSWNIPIVSILWIEACKKHLILMNPNEYPIPNLEKYENPDLYEKTKRHKYIQPDTLMKRLHRPIPKSKILGELKKTHENSSILSTTANKTVFGSPNVSQRSMIRKTTASLPVKAVHPRKSLGPKKLDEPPKNTIRSMFAKQLEKSQTDYSQVDSSQMNGTIDQITSLNINDALAVEKSPGKEDDKVSNSEQTGDISLVTGSLHKRLTRRNSMTISTPTKSAPKSDVVDSTTATAITNSMKKRRCTMFAPSFKGYIDEEQDTSIDSNSSALIDKTILTADKTVHRSMAMDVCNESKGEAAIKCNSKVRQLLNNELSKTPRENGKNGMDSKFVLPASRLNRRTTFTAQAMDETKVQSSSNTPVSVTKRRMTMNVQASSTPRAKVANRPDLNESKSCDAVLTPTNKAIGSSNAFSSTPLIQTLSKTHLDRIRSSTSKSLLDEYNNTFSSTKTPLSDKRKTVANITMDIIKQRIENINRNASFNRSTTDFLDDSCHNDIKSTPTSTENVGKVSSTVAPASEPAAGKANQLKPLKRKLFAPPSLFPENSPIAMATPQKTDKKTVQKRKRNDLPIPEGKTSKSDEKKKPVEKPRPSRKTMHSRRSTMFFETPPNQKANDDSASQSSTVSSTITSTATKIGATPGLVFTSMHQPQIDFITEAIKKLGKFKLEDKVSPTTTHLVAFDSRRTINLLRGLVRGVWILNYDWIMKSVAAKKWQPESEHEMTSFSKAVEINRIERQAFGPKYRMDIFRHFDTFYLSPNCTCKSLKELLTLCYGKVVQNQSKARYIISEHYRTDLDNTESLLLHPNWILDSISIGKVAKPAKYILKANV